MSAPCPFCHHRDGSHAIPCLGGFVSVRAQPLPDGATVEPQDHARLGRQADRVRELMSDGAWWTLAALAERVGASEAGVSARVRDLRKPRFGGYVVERKREGSLFSYRMVAATRREVA